MDAYPLPLDWLQMLTGLCGGLALFLFGMERMGEALKAVAGARMKQVLGRLTSNRFAGAATGDDRHAHRLGSVSA